MSEHSHLLPRYKHLRRVGLELNNRLMTMVSKSDFEEGGKKLGILKKTVLTLDTQDEIAVLADFCIHDVRRQGINAIGRFLAESPPPADSDEMVLLQALLQARFSLFAVEATEPGWAFRSATCCARSPCSWSISGSAARLRWGWSWQAGSWPRKASRKRPERPCPPGCCPRRKGPPFCKVWQPLPGAEMSTGCPRRNTARGPLSSFVPALKKAPRSMSSTSIRDRESGETSDRQLFRYRSA